MQVPGSNLNDLEAYVVSNLVGEAWNVVEKIDKQLNVLQLQLDRFLDAAPQTSSWGGRKLTILSSTRNTLASVDKAEDTIEKVKKVKNSVQELEKDLSQVEGQLVGFLSLTNPEESKKKKERVIEQRARFEVMEAQAEEIIRRQETVVELPQAARIQGFFSQSVSQPIWLENQGMPLTSSMKDIEREIQRQFNSLNQDDDPWGIFSSLI